MGPKTHRGMTGKDRDRQTLTNQREGRQFANSLNLVLQPSEPGEFQVLQSHNGTNLAGRDPILTSKTWFYDVELLGSGT